MGCPILAAVRVVARHVWQQTVDTKSDEGDGTVLRKEVASIRARSVSLMPGGLEGNLGKQGLAHRHRVWRGGLLCRSDLLALLFSKQNFYGQLKDARIPVGAG